MSDLLCTLTDLPATMCDHCIHPAAMQGKCPITNKARYDCHHCTEITQRNRINPKAVTENMMKHRPKYYRGTTLKWGKVRRGVIGRTSIPARSLLTP